MSSVLPVILQVSIVCAVNVICLPTTDDILRFFKGVHSLEEDLTYPTTTDTLIAKAGYQPEVHRVVTEDGYILRLTRIKTLNVGQPVLMVHGLFAASDMWLQRGPKSDLALILADEGFDVWLADFRGNVFSRKHKYLKPSQPEFMDFSFHEMGLYDLPAFIQEVRKFSPYEKIFYIGHSMGCTSFFVLTSLRPEFNKYIQTAVMLSPVVFGVQRVRSKVVSAIFEQIVGLTNTLKAVGLYSIAERNVLIRNFIKTACGEGPLQLLCLNLLGDLVGENRINLDKAKLQDYFTTLASGASLKTILHFSQIFITGEFKAFDYGLRRNLQLYGQPAPKFYYLNVISAPIVLFYSTNDYYVDEKNVQQIKNVVQNVIYKEALPKYTHIDYIFGNDAPRILYSKIVKIFHKEMPNC